MSSSFSDKLELLLQNFDLKARIGHHPGHDSGSGCCKPFVICEQQVGIIRPDFWQHLSRYGHVFIHDTITDTVTLNPDWRTYEERSAKMENLLQELRRHNIFTTLTGWREECYDVSSRFGEPPLMKMERSATCLFGIKRYGVHINGYVTHNDGSVSLWIQRRSSTKQTWPGKLDNLVSGGFSVGMTVQECVRKEAQEEASIPDDLLDTMKPSGTVSFIFEDERGVFPEILFVFDLELPLDFTPENSDNEVESFHLLSVEDLKRILVTDDFKTTSSLVTLDFLVRHGCLNPDTEPNYTQLVEMIHTPLQNMYP